MTHPSVRLRFAPAPTGMMHLGNVRAALMNYLFARQKSGTFIVRIEDTDAERNYDPQATEIINDLAWLGLNHDEGPQTSGPYAPYFQSQRTSLYQEKLEALIKNSQVYRCFCTPTVLEEKRKIQHALGQPPRYDRACTKLTDEVIATNLSQNRPFIWRFLLNTNARVVINDLAHGATTFELQHFSDFPLTRSDGSFTFIFANFVDDMCMAITHIFRGEDHLTNSACQAALFHAFNHPLPLYWHMPILCNLDGKKLSKRDFGFSLKDLQHAGYLHEAIINYLAIIGGSFSKEIMTKKELIAAIDFEHLHTTGHIKYDSEKLRWVNHKWISTYDTIALTNLCMPYLEKAYPTIVHYDPACVHTLIEWAKSEMYTLCDSVELLQFYFVQPVLQRTLVLSHISEQLQAIITPIIKESIAYVHDPASFITYLQKSARQHRVTLKELYHIVRLALTGKATGPGIGELLTLLSTEETIARLNAILHHLP